MSEERPDGPLSGLLYDFDQRLAAARRHAAAEGLAVDARTVLDSYDRVLHPVMHGRRPHDLVERHGKPAAVAYAGAGLFAVYTLIFAGMLLLGDADAVSAVTLTVVSAVALLAVGMAVDARGEA